MKCFSLSSFCHIHKDLPTFRIIEESAFDTKRIRTLEFDNNEQNKTKQTK